MIKQTKEKLKSKLCFVKINACYKDVLDFYKKLFIYFNFKIIPTGQEYRVNATDGDVKFLISNTVNLNKKMRVLIPSIGGFSMSFRVKDKNQVNKFEKNFLGSFGIKPFIDLPKEGSTKCECSFKNRQCDFISIFSFSKGDKNDFSNKKLGINYFGIQVVNKKSLYFFRDLFFYLGYKLTKHFRFKKHRFEELVFCDNKMQFNVFVEDKGMQNTEGSGIDIIHSGVDTFFFKVEDKKVVAKFIKDFLKPRKINFRFNNPYREEEGKYSVFFNTPEKLTIGIVSN